MHYLLKNAIVTSLILLFSGGLFAQKGYDIKVNFKQPVKDSVIYLARYFAKPIGQTIYVSDTATRNKKGGYTFTEKEDFLGGIYLILFDNQRKWIELILDDGVKMDITIDTTDIVNGTIIKGSEENLYNQKFHNIADEFSQKMNALKAKYADASTPEDSLQISDEIKQANAQFYDDRSEFIKLLPNKSLLRKILKSLEVPEVPKGPHYLDDGKTIDSMYSFNYSKNHYWDNFDLQDDRMIHTPLYDNKLKVYFDNYVLPIPDSMKYEADKLLNKTRGTSEIFKYTLHFLGNYTRTSKVMGMDEVFVYLVENYYMKGDAWWLDSTSLQKYYIEPAQKIAPNVIGNLAPELSLKDAFTLAPVNLHDVDAKYILLIFWEPSCHSCQEAVPAIDSMYRNGLQQMGVKVFSMPLDEKLSTIQEAVTKYGIRDWINVIDTDGSSKFKQKYNAYSVPVIYVLDKDKIIRGKNLAYQSLPLMFDLLQKQESKMAQQAGK